MVYLREVLDYARTCLAETNNIEYATYLFLRDPAQLAIANFDLTPE